jgi:hypothetical protein
MSEKRGLLARIFGPKETACCGGVEFEEIPSEAKTPAAAAPAEAARKCCGSSKTAAQES